MIARAVAGILAEVVFAGPTDETLGILDVARFEEHRPVRSPHLV
jgi:hypothetical protein